MQTDRERKGIGRGAFAAAARSCAVACLLLLSLFFASSGVGGAINAEEIIDRMESAYGNVHDYRMTVEVRSYAGDGSSGIERFLYSFKKPDRIRLDFEEPHPGMIVIYPDGEGKVYVRPGGLWHLFTFHLSPDNRLLAASPGQRIDQTDLGLLIRNIAGSLTSRRLGPVTIVEEAGVIRIRVLAADHFLAGVTTLYQFLIDDRVWLPQGVEEATPAGRVRRVVAFRDLRTNIGIPDEFFRTGGAHG